MENNHDNDFNREGQQPDQTGMSHESLEHNEYISHTKEDPGLTKPVRPPKPPKPSKPAKGHKKSHPIVSGMVGGIISAVIVAALFLTNVIPVQNSQHSTAGQSATTDGNHDATPVLADSITHDDADIATGINDTYKAVVGILNMQQQNIWTQSKEVASGSGIIYKKKNGKAYIVTNNHVVEGAKELEVVLNNGNDDHVKAKVLGTDKLTDLAVLEIDGSKVDTIAKLGSSKDLKVGQTVIAIGDPLGMKFSGSVTKGIVSGLNRSINVDTNGDNVPDWVTEVIQTDAAINPGNSGGALVNSNGEVIGINSMKIAKETVEGIGFAIPIDSARPIMKELEKDGKIARPFIGISTVTLDQVPIQYRQNIQLPDIVKKGMVVADVEAASPADAAGLQKFDVITKMDGQKIETLLDLRKYMYSKTKIGDKIKVEFYRDGKKQTTHLTLAKRKDNQ